MMRKNTTVMPGLVSRAYRDFRLTSIGGGADEVILMVLCKMMGILPGPKKGNGR
jgi:citronellyl-CoA dehydrogenase